MFIGYGTKGNCIRYGYDVGGRVEKIGTEADDDFFASYAYDRNGNLLAETLSNGSIPRSFAYHSPGWLRSIEDPDYFAQTLHYTQGAYDASATGKRATFPV